MKLIHLTVFDMTSYIISFLYINEVLIICFIVVAIILAFDGLYRLKSKYPKEEMISQQEIPASNRCLFVSWKLFRVFGGIFCVLFILALSIPFLVDAVESIPPKDSYYKKMLEKIVGEPLPTCKILKKKYQEDAFEVVVFQMAFEDYHKVYNAFSLNNSFRIDKDLIIYDVASEVVQKKYGEEIEWDLKYWGLGGWAFKSPDILIYQRNLY